MAIIFLLKFLLILSITFSERIKIGLLTIVIICYLIFLIPLKYSLILFYFVKSQILKSEKI